MSRISLRAAFALAPGSPVSAQQVFTNRISEVTAFDEAVRALSATLSAPGSSPVTDRGQPRRNVLAYYGVGGIGKTTLSQELERRFTCPPGAAQDSERDSGRAAVRFDFAEPAAFDIESYLLRLRAGLGHLAGSWHAFDVAFSVYWQRAHPSETLDEFITKDSALRRVSRTVGLSEQISATLTDAFGAALPGVARAAHVVGELLYTQARKAIIGHRILRNCDLLTDLIEADPDIDTLSYFPYLLAWDLAQLPAPHPRAIVLLDTFEEVTARATRETERWLQRSAYLMPNVLFVITGRNRLDWADLTHATELDFTGPARWPLLRAGQNGAEPRQHLVGYLSPADADSYLVCALTSNGSPAIPAPVRSRIVAAAGGLPLYLDLAVTTYLDLLARGETPMEDNFGQPLPEVCSKLIRDLDRQERDLLRAAALLATFDPAMLRSACPHVPDSALARFTTRPFLEMDPDRTWPYSLHATLRDAIRQADTDLRDSWSPRERAEVAARIGGHLSQAATTAARAGDRTVLAAAITEALGLCLLTGQFFPWLPRSAQQLLACGGWGLLPDPPAASDGPAHALILGLQAARERRTGKLSDAITLTEQALRQPLLPPELRQFLLLHHANALRVAGQYAAAASDYQTLASAPGDFADDARYWLADYSFLQGHFAGALSALGQLTGTTAELRGEILRLQGHANRVNALFDTAEARYREALDLARETRNIAAEGKALTDLIQTLAWTRAADARDLVPRATETNEALGNQVEVVKIRAANAVALARLGEPEQASTEIGAGAELARQCGYSGGQVWCQVAAALTQLTRREISAARDTAASLAGTVSQLQGNRFWSEIVYWWTSPGPDPAAPPPATEWLDGTDAARARWLAVLPAPRPGADTEPA